jgi:hypothetical membrane protein
MTTHALHPPTTRARPGSRAGSRDDRRLPGLLMFTLAAQFMTVVMLAASMAPSHDITGGAISDLGVIPESAALFNVSLVVTGLLNLLAGYLLYRSHRRRWIVVVFTLAAIGAAGAGIVPLDVSGAHGLFALLGFLCFNLEPLAMAPLLRGPMRFISYLAAMAGLLFVGLMVIGDAGDPSVFGAIGHGGAERMIVYPVMLWMMAVGGYLMADTGETATDDGASR